MNSWGWQKSIFLPSENKAMLFTAPAKFLNTFSNIFFFNYTNIARICHPKCYSFFPRVSNSDVNDVLNIWKVSRNIASLSSITMFMWKSQHGRTLLNKVILPRNITPVLLLVHNKLLTSLHSGNKYGSLGVPWDSVLCLEMRISWLVGG